MADQSKRMEMLVRQGLMPAQKLPILKKAIARVKMGGALLPNEREVIKDYMDKLMFIVFGDDTVFNRAKQHTQRARYQTEEQIVNQLDERVVDGVEIVDGEEQRIKDEKRAQKLGRKSKSEKMKSFAKSLRKEKEKQEVDESIIKMNEDYKEKFNAALKKFGVSSIRDLPADKKKKFFNTVDNMHVSDDEKKGVDESTGGAMSKDKESHDTGGFRIPNKDANAARDRLKNKNKEKFPGVQGESVEEAKMIPGFMGADGKPTSKPTAKDFAANKEYQHMKKKLGDRIPGPKPTKEEVEENQLDEYITAKQIRMAKGIANDPRHKGGDYTGAAKKMEKIKKGLSNHPAAKKALRQANESMTPNSHGWNIQQHAGELAKKDGHDIKKLPYGHAQGYRDKAKKALERNEEMTPEQKAKRLELIRLAAQKLKAKDADAEKRAAAAAKRDMSRPGAQKGMAPVKKEETYLDINTLREYIKHSDLSKEKIQNMTRSEAYKLLNQIIKSKGE